MLNEMRLFQRKHDKYRYMRHAVVTNGDTVPVGGIPLADVVDLRDRLAEARQDENWTLCRELREGIAEHRYFDLRRIQSLNRTVSRFADWARGKHGIGVQFRGTEFTVKERDGDGALSVHPHANVLHTPR